MLVGSDCGYGSLGSTVYLAMEVAAPEKTEDGSRYSIDVKA
jgi:hypothetical protein